MATIVNNPGNTDSGAAGWAVAVIVLLAAGLIAFFVWPGYVRTSEPEGATTINVSVPALDTATGGPVTPE